MRVMKFLEAAAVALAGGLIALAATAQTFPSKNVALVVPYPAGGSGDYFARLIQPGYQKRLGQTMVVENVGGASGALGVQKVLSAPADGHYELLGTPMDLVLAPMGLAAVKHKPEDLRLAGVVASSSLVLLVNKDIPASNIDEFIAWAKKRPSVSYGSSGTGSLFHVVGAKFAQSTGLNMVHVPYKGGSQFFTDIVGGQIDIAFWTLAGPTLGLLKEGKVKALGITSREPHPMFPELPLMSQHKLLPDFTYDLWLGVLVPKATPDAAVATINTAMNEVIQLPAVRTGTQDTGAQSPRAMSQAELDKFYTSEIERYRRVFKSTKLEPQ
ncbi:tripartite tricarboxylate transporter substrate binding protein [Variovorax sp. dw_954]|uniref:Bug family tripartite tricarboxylate transporter substrate binding protein n=1 Tax=Variovorax sp. dw_954 TaxID=2720078 RepID=UPI001BD213E3|nr:tripartite tricarboxylate transporter substrate binding protein [Variovorax sp. dw_954]